MPLAALVLARLRSPGLPASLVPTRAIELAPPALAGATYLDLRGAAPDLVSYAFLLAVAVVAAGQLRFIPSYARLRFGPGFWAFTFSCASVVALGFVWLKIEHAAGASAFAFLAAGAVSLLTTAIAGRSLLVIPRGNRLSTPKRLEGAFDV
jgi:tellurite resistance protein